jgi:MerR family transcriptional regulator, light-induced transcriptional regulator
VSGDAASVDGGRPGYDAFRPLIDAEDKEGCVSFALSFLESTNLDIATLYEMVLAPAAREQHCTIRERPLCIWEEHVRTSIIRTVIECCYPQLMRARRALSGDKTRGPAVIVCPTEEYHELGARMAADFFTLCGFDVTFVGANTPQHEILEAVGFLHPVFAGVSVTSPYNLIAARRTIQQLVTLRRNTSGQYRIVAGGRAFGTNEAMARSLGADLVVQTYDDIRRISEEIPWSSR